MAKYAVDIKNSGDSVFQVSTDAYTLSVDTNGHGIRPPSLLLASLGTCVGVYINYYKAKNAIDLDGFDISVEGEFLPEKPVRFKAITIVVNTKGKKLEAHVQQKLIEFVKNCPVHNTLLHEPEIKISIA